MQVKCIHILVTSMTVAHAKGEKESMDENDNKLRTLIDSPMKFSRTLLPIILSAILPAILIYIFGFSIKSTPEYACAVDIVGENRQVISVIGSPLKPGIFAWIRFFESGGLIRQGAFFTSIYGPHGDGRIEVNFYRSPVGESLSIWFTSEDLELQVFDDGYPCSK